MKRDPGKISSYFYWEWKMLAVITATGIFYNIGMAAGPWFEGRLAQLLADIFGGTKVYSDMVRMVVLYIVTILFVQGMRAWKRLEVRRFANAINKRMKNTIYRNLLSLPVRKINEENTGAMMTKAIADVDACVEGIRKFTTEVFDTGVVMVTYMVMLLGYDWRLALIVMLFPPIAYILAERLKSVVTAASARSKESAGKLNGASLERVSNALTYRVYGLEENRNRLYEESLQDYEKAQVRSNVLVSSVQPIYQMISMLGAFFILYYGGKNVMGQGWTTWDIAAFSTFMACFVKLSTKTSKAAKLFNSVQKAQVSWARIRPYMQDVEYCSEIRTETAQKLEVKDVSFAYPNGPTLFKGLSFEAVPGEIIGVTGEIACGKSTLGRLFLDEYPSEGEILWGGKDIRSLMHDPACRLVGYLGHDPQLFSGSVEENIRMGEQKNTAEIVKMVALDKDIASFPDGIQTAVGEKGSRLSGGQQARLGLGRTLYQDLPLLVLDDPFASVDETTEREIFARLKKYAENRIVILISHRLELFDQMNQVLFLKDGKVLHGTHQTLLEENEDYRKLVVRQEGERTYA